jgi:hypothetical protein
MRRKWLIALGIVALVAVALAVLRVAVLDRRLTSKPELRAGEGAPHESTSFFSVSVRLRYDALAELVNDQFPDVIAIPETSLAGGRSARTAVLGSGQVEKLAPVVISGSGSAVQAATRLKASYALGNAMLGTETLQAEARVALATAFDIDERWKPVIAIQPAIDWVQPPESRLTRMFGLSLAGLADQQVTALASRLEQQLPALIEERFSLPGLLGRTWEAAHVRLQVSDSPAAWLTLQPLGAHFLTPQALDDALSLDLGFSASLGVSPDPSGQAPAPGALPPLGKQAPPVEGIRIAVPVTVDYATLAAAINAALAKQAFSFDVGGGRAEIRIDDVVVYPSAPQVVLGLHVEARLPRQWLDTRGWVYVSAVPAFDATSGVLELTDLRFARAVDNAWVRAFSAALHQRLEAELSRHARLELGPLIDAATDAVNERIHAEFRQVLESRLQGGPSRLAERIAVEGGLDGIESADFTLAAGGITLHPVVTGSLAVVLVPLYAPATPQHAEGPEPDIVHTPADPPSQSNREEEP